MRTRSLSLVAVAIMAGQMSADSRVSLKVFNLLGQEVATMVESERLAGHHEERRDARGFASGVYVYQLSLTDEKGSAVRNLPLSGFPAFYDTVRRGILMPLYGMPQSGRSGTEQRDNRQIARKAMLLLK